MGTRNNQSRAELKSGLFKPQWLSRNPTLKGAVMKKSNRKKLTRILIGISIAWILIAGLVAIIFTSVPAEQWVQWRQDMAENHRGIYGDRFHARMGIDQSQETFRGPGRNMNRFHGSYFGHGRMGLFLFIPGLFTIIFWLLVFRWAKKYRSKVQDPIETLRQQYANGALNDQEFTSRLKALERKE
jgi:uncharacterized membrane protein